MEREQIMEVLRVNSISGDCPSRLVPDWAFKDVADRIMMLDRLPGTDEKETDVRDVASRYTLDRLIGVLCEYYGVTLEQVRSKARHSSIVKVRAVYALMSREMGFATKRSGLHINRDHATIIHHTKKLRDYLNKSKFYFRPELYEEIEGVRRVLISCK